ncbi:flagellar basal body P-ring formation chaperone FlgA [Oceanisphaera sp. W20_SRM_FM3]|uniref:flagellar basal body P-ring formation chaperone FlgA n=1 Tax=Oceanisphaera sp. W20_SRM_FM3 TaxID=3240267 RepID=UPI003F9DD6D0
MLLSAPPLLAKELAQEVAKEVAKELAQEQAQAVAPAGTTAGIDIAVEPQLAAKREPEPLAEMLSLQLISVATQRLTEYAVLQRWQPYQAEFSPWLPASVAHLPSCQKAVRYEVAQADAKPWGRIAYLLACIDEPGWTLRGRITVEVSLPVWVAAESLKREQALNADLLRLQSMNLSQLHRGFISSLQPPKRRLLRNLSKDQPLYPAILAPLWLVQKNEQVVIEARGENFAVSTQGLALGNASKGELVLVQNIDSGKRMQARVVARNKVQTLR